MTEHERDVRDLYRDVQKRMRLLRSRISEIQEVLDLLKRTKDIIRRPKGGIIKKTLSFFKTVTFAIMAKVPQEVAEKENILDGIHNDVADFGLKVEQAQAEIEKWTRRLIFLGFPKHTICEGKGCEGCDWTGVDWDRYVGK